MPERGSKSSTVPVVSVNFLIFSARSKDLLRRLVAMEDIWLYHYDPETKQQSMECRYSGSPRPKKIPSSKIRWKSSRLDFLESRRHPLPKGQTIKAEYYLSLLVQLNDILREKCRGNVTKGALFLHDNAPAHRALATQKKLAYLGFQCLYHPPHFSGSGPVGIPAVLWTEKQLKGRHFSFDAEVIAVAETSLDGQLSNFFLSGLQKLEQRAKKCIELRGEYVE